MMHRTSGGKESSSNGMSFGQTADFKSIAMHQIMVRKNKIGAQAPLASNQKNFTREDFSRIHHGASLFATITMPGESFERKMQSTSRLQHQTQKQFTMTNQINLPNMITRKAAIQRKPVYLKKDQSRQTSLQSSMRQPIQTQTRLTLQQRNKSALVTKGQAILIEAHNLKNQAVYERLQARDKKAIAAKIIYPDVIEKFGMQELEPMFRRNKKRQQPRASMQERIETFAEKQVVPQVEDHVIDTLISRLVSACLTKPLQQRFIRSLSRKSTTMKKHGATDNQNSSRRVNRQSTKTSLLFVMEEGDTTLDYAPQTENKQQLTSEQLRLSNQKRNNSKQSVSSVTDAQQVLQLTYPSNSKSQARQYAVDMDKTVFIGHLHNDDDPLKAKLLGEDFVSRNKNGSPFSSRAKMVYEQNTGTGKAGNTVRDDKNEEFDWSKAPTLFQIKDGWHSKQIHNMQDGLQEYAGESLNLQIVGVRPFRSPTQRFDDIHYSTNGQTLDEQRVSQLNPIQSNSQMLHQNGIPAGGNLTVEKKHPMQRLNTMKQSKTSSEFEGLKQAMKFGSRIFHNQPRDQNDFDSEAQTSVFFVDGPPIGHNEKLLQLEEHAPFNSNKSKRLAAQKKTGKNHHPLTKPQKGLTKIYQSKVKSLTRAKEKLSKMQTNNRSPPSLSLERSLSNRSSVGMAANFNHNMSRGDIKVVETSIEPERIYGDGRFTKDMMVTQSAIPDTDEDDDEFEVSDHMLNDTVFLQKPSNRNPSIGGDLPFQTGGKGNGSVYQESHMLDYLSQTTYNTKPIKAQRVSQSIDEIQDMNRYNYNAIPLKQQPAGAGECKQSSLLDSNSFMSYKEQKKLQQQHNNDFGDTRQVVMNKFKQSSTHAYMQSTLPSFLNRKDEEQAIIAQENKLDNKMASYRNRKEVEKQSKLELGKQQSSTSPKGLFEITGSRKAPFVDTFNGHSTVGGQSLRTDKTQRLTHKSAAYNAKNSSQKSMGHKFHSDVNKMPRLAPTSQQPSEMHRAGKNLLPLKNRLQIKAKLAGRTVLGGTAPTTKAIPVKSQPSSVSRDIQKIERLQERASGMEIRQILELTKNNNAGAVNQTSEYKSQQRLQRYRQQNFKQSSGKTELSFYNPSDSQASMNFLKNKNRQSEIGFSGASQSSSVGRTMRGTLFNGTKNTNTKDNTSRQQDYPKTIRTSMATHQRNFGTSFDQEHPHVSVDAKINKSQTKLPYLDDDPVVSKRKTSTQVRSSVINSQEKLEEQDQIQYEPSDTHISHNLSHASQPRKSSQLGSKKNILHGSASRVGLNQQASKKTFKSIKGVMISSQLAAGDSQSRQQEQLFIPNQDDFISEVLDRVMVSQKHLLPSMTTSNTAAATKAHIVNGSHNASQGDYRSEQMMIQRPSKQQQQQQQQFIGGGESSRRADVAMHKMNSSMSSSMASDNMVIQQNISSMLVQSEKTTARQLVELDRSRARQKQKRAVHKTGGHHQHSTVRSKLILNSGEPATQADLVDEPLNQSFDARNRQGPQSIPSLPKVKVAGRMSQNLDYKSTATQSNKRLKKRQSSLQTNGNFNHMVAMGDPTSPYTNHVEDRNQGYDSMPQMLDIRQQQDNNNSSSQQPTNSSGFNNKNMMGVTQDTIYEQDSLEREDSGQSNVLMRHQHQPDVNNSNISVQQIIVIQMQNNDGNNQVNVNQKNQKKQHESQSSFQGTVKLRPLKNMNLAKQPNKQQMSQK